MKKLHFLFSGAALLILTGLLFGYPAHAHEDHGAQDEFFRAEVIKIVEEGIGEVAGTQSPYQILHVKALNGSHDGERITIEYGTKFTLDEAHKVKEGEKIVVNESVSDGETHYFIVDVDRSTPLITIAIFFVISCLFFGRIKGFTALLGMAFSLVIVITFLIPAIVRGANPLLVSLAATFIIAGISLYLAHGFHRKTTIALMSTFITLAISTGLSTLFVWFTRLSGMANEQTTFLQWGSFPDLNFQGLLLGGIILGTLGVLDDITTAQTAVVYELKHANPSLSFRELYRRASNVGQEHIAALVNTLVLAYVGVGLPTLLLLTKDSDMPFWIAVNSEVIAEEIVRALVGSIALVFAVPITTYLAARAFSKKHQ